MIQELKTATPFITFGYGLTQMSVPGGTSVTVWLNTMFDQSVYSFQLVYSGATMVKISNYEYRITYNTPGAHNIYLNVSFSASAKDKQTLKSNTITVTTT